MNYTLLKKNYPNHKSYYPKMFYLTTNSNLEIPHLENAPKRNGQCKHFFYDFPD